MNLDNTFLSVAMAVLGLFLTFVSLKLNSVIESNAGCMSKNALVNSNRLVLIVGIVLFMSSAGYLVCQRNCSNLTLASSTSDTVFLSFNLVLGIVIIVLFSIISSELNKCNVSLSGLDSTLIVFGIIVGVCATVLSLVVLGKKLYENKEDAMLKLQQMKINAMANAQDNLNKLKAMATAKDNLKASSPNRVQVPWEPNRGVQWEDPFGY